MREQYDSRFKGTIGESLITGEDLVSGDGSCGGIFGGGSAEDVDKGFHWRVLNTICTCPCISHGTGQVLTFVHRQADDLHAGEFAGKGGRHLHTIELGHRDVNDHDVRTEFTCHFNRFFAVTRLADNAQIWLLFQKGDQAFAKKLMVVGHKNPENPVGVFRTKLGRRWDRLDVLACFPAGDRRYRNIGSGSDAGGTNHFQKAAN